MRVMVLVKATEDSEKGFVRTVETMKMMEAMGRFNDELIRVGTQKAGTVTVLRPRRRANVLHSKVLTVRSSMPLSISLASWPLVSGFGKSKTWTRCSPGCSAAPIPCQDQARSKSARYTRCLILNNTHWELNCLTIFKLRH